MATTFTDFMTDLQREANAEGPEAVAELKYFRERLRLGRQFAEARQKRGWTKKNLAIGSLWAGLGPAAISTSGR